MVEPRVKSQAVDPSISAHKHYGILPLILAKNTATRISLFGKKDFLIEYIKHFRCGLEIGK